MPNGYELSHEEFLFLDCALKDIDAVLKPFAAEIKGGITREYHSYPCRRIELRKVAGIEKMISISPITAGEGASSKKPHYGVTIWATHGTGKSRRWWHKEITRFCFGQMTPDAILPILIKAWAELKPIDLDFIMTNGRA